MRVALTALLLTVLLTACGGGQSPDSAYYDKHARSGHRIESTFKRDKREDPIPTYSRPYPG